jgi:EmrB/QacA subfamily drug resistance transporter
LVQPKAIATGAKIGGQHVGASDSTAAIKRLLPWLVAVSFFMESLDITILNTAVPTIAASLGVGPLSLKSALTSYTLSLALFIPLSGWLADKFGTRRVFGSAIGIFTLGSLLCGLSFNLPCLIAARVLQGMGGAMMMPVGRIAIVRTFEKAEILRAMSFVLIPGLIGPLIGPLVGGFIVGLFHWRAIFLVNLPIGVLGLYAVHRYMPDYRFKHTPPLDLAGFILFGSGIASLSYVLEIFGHHSLNWTYASLLLVGSLSLLVAYGWHAVRAPHPILQLGLFRIRTFRVAVIGGFVSRLGIGGMPFLLPLFYQVGLGHTPIQAALLIMPQPLASMTTKFFVQPVLSRIGFRRLLRTNTIFIGLMQMSFATISPTTPAWLIVTQAFAYGFVTSLQFTSINTLQFADLEAERTSMGSSIASVFQQLALSFGVAIASLATALFIGANPFIQSDHASMTSAVRKAFLVVGSLTIISTLLFRELKPGDGSNVSSHRNSEPAEA